MKIEKGDSSGYNNSNGSDNRLPAGRQVRGAVFGEEMSWFRQRVLIWGVI